MGINERLTLLEQTEPADAKKNHFAQAAEAELNSFHALATQKISQTGTVDLFWLETRLLDVRIH